MSKPNPAPASTPEDGLDEFLLHYTASNPSGKSTIVLIHGAFVSGLNWDLVVPHLTMYHLLIPDLPGHGQSRNITPFSVEYSSRLLAQLIRKHAVNGRAHVVGHSLGAHVAINLASSYPELMDAVFVSGFEIYPPIALSRMMPYAMWTENRAQNLIPRSAIRWLMDGTDLPRGDASTCTIALCHEITQVLLDMTWPSPWPARTLIVAAGKGGIIPSNDHPHDAVKLMEIGKECNPETIAVTHPAMRHPWNRQAPRLFAETAYAWFEREELRSEFVKL
jgi:pimeloyl-ACP methyl ester carboxylesterase